MRTRTTRPLAAAWFVWPAFVCLTVSSTSAAQTAAQCVAAFDRGQELQATLSLRAAREAYLACSRATCHVLVRKDCAARLEEVARDMPTLIVGARDRDGKDLHDVRVFVDGAEVDASKRGAALEVDPGSRSLRLELEQMAPYRETLVVRVGEKNRNVVVTLEPRGEPQPKPFLGRPAPERRERPRGAPRPLVFALAGASVLSFGGFAAFGLAGLSERNHLLDSCAAACSEREAAVVRDRYLAADIFLGVALLTGAAAAILEITRPAPVVSQARAR